MMFAHAISKHPLHTIIFQLVVTAASITRPVLSFMLWLQKLLDCRLCKFDRYALTFILVTGSGYVSGYFSGRRLPGNVPVETFSNHLISLIEQNKGLALDSALCDQAFRTAQRCAKSKRISHTSMTGLRYQEQFQAEVRRGAFSE